LDSIRWAFKEFDRHPPGRLGIYEEDNIQEMERLLLLERKPKDMDCL
jgi:hypothetical protein